MKIEEAILTNGLEIIKTFATSEDQTLDVMKRFHQHHNYFIDPHTGKLFFLIFSSFNLIINYLNFFKKNKKELEFMQQNNSSKKIQKKN